MSIGSFRSLILWSLDQYLVYRMCSVNACKMIENIQAVSRGWIVNTFSIHMYNQSLPTLSPCSLLLRAYYFILVCICYNRLFHEMSNGFRERRLVHWLIPVHFCEMKEWESKPNLTQLFCGTSLKPKLRDKIYSEVEPKYWFNINTLFELT